MLRKSIAEGEGLLQTKNCKNSKFYQKREALNSNPGQLHTNQTAYQYTVRNRQISLS